MQYALLVWMDTMLIQGHALFVHLNVSLALIRLLVYYVLMALQNKLFLQIHLLWSILTSV